MIEAIHGQVSQKAVLDAEAVALSFAQAGLKPPGCALDLVRAWPDRKSGLVALYADPVAGQRDRWWAVHAAHEGTRRALREALGSGRAFMLEGVPAIAHRLTDDPLVPGLSALVDSATVPLMLKPWFDSLGAWEDLEARVVSYKPMRRCVIRYRSVSSPNEPTLFAKVFRAGRAEAVWKDYAALSAAAARGLPELKCARPCALAAPDHTILWHEQPGTSVGALLETTGAFAAVTQAGDLLGSLHRSKTAWSRIHGPDRETATAARWAAAVGAAWPKVKGDLDFEVAALEAAGTSEGGSTLVPSHRDFYDKQVLVDGTSAAFIDLDTASLAEPELDVANFVAHLELRCLQGRIRHTDRIAKGFLDAYAGGHQRPDPGRFRFYKASALLRLACVYALRANDWSGLSASLLAQARSCRTANEALVGGL